MMEKKVSPKLIKSLEKNCEDYRRSERIRDLYLLDMEFHSAIIKNSGSVQLHDILEKRLILLNSFYLTTAVVVIPTIESIERSYQEHAAILQAIRKNELNTALPSGKCRGGTPEKHEKTRQKALLKAGFASMPLFFMFPPQLITAGNTCGGKKIKLLILQFLQRTLLFGD